MSEDQRDETGGKAKLYEELEAALLSELLKRLRSGEATASELATAAALLGKAGTPARTAGANVKGSEESAMVAWLDSLPADEKARMLAEAELMKGGPRVRTGRVKAGKADAGELGNAA